MENVAKVRINGKSCMALLDNGVQVNTIMLRYVQEHSLPVGPITDLMDSKVTCVGLGNSYTRLLGYAIVQVQVDRVRGYDEDQIALIIPDFSHFANRVAHHPGNPYHWASCEHVMKEADMDALAMPWVNARAAHLLAMYGGWHQWRWKMTGRRGTIPAKKVSSCTPENVETLGTFFLPHVIPIEMMGGLLERMP